MLNVSSVIVEDAPNVDWKEEEDVNISVVGGVLVFVDCDVEVELTNESDVSVVAVLIASVLVENIT